MKTLFNKKHEYKKMVQFLESILNMNKSMNIQLKFYI